MAEYRGTAAAHESADGISFLETVGFLWYTLFIATRQRRAHGLSGGQPGRRSSSGSLSSNKKEHGTEASSSSGLPPAAASELSSEASSAEKAFGKWGEVNWVLLAAHVYALTRQLHTDTEVRCIIVHNIFHNQFHDDCTAMEISFSKKHAHLLASYAQAEEQRAAAAAVATTATVNPPAPPFGTSALGSTHSTAAESVKGRLPSPQQTSHVQQSTVLTHEPQKPITAGITHNPSSFQASASYLAASTSSTPSSLTSASAAVLQQQQPCEGRDTSGVCAPLAPAAPATTTTSTRSASWSIESATRRSPPKPIHGGGTAAGGRLHTPPSHDARGGADSCYGHGMPAVAAAPTSGDGTPSSPSAAANADGARRGDGLRRGTAPAPAIPPHASSVVAASPIIEPDPLDAPWHTLWCSLPTQRARAQLQALRFRTPIPIEDFSSLLEQFFLVDGADDFLSPVHAATIMEFAGVRSDPYHSIVRAPLSLAEVSRYITESHLQYARAVTTTHHEHSAGGKSTHLAVAGLGQPKEGAGHSRRRRGSSGCSGNAGADAPGLLNVTSSNERRILTVAELERSVWHIAANCVVFNAPESRYPRTARRFAASCIEILTRYCEKQMAAYLAS
ncbi:hypothetical protein ABL78_7187 [Leptomonas seymouri]|uniref:Uncharacterized protein n=1 Tax=Leptomonas seymouri TaxID=5684 RepID=A0A0N1II72_LEPSE|nr:hypothetical protein ABL78_7187 [Leptomonas seymouri]|eukprot:KPI83771.1 hypothetical protein ABL78_7187 [Leptomonas seymouri]